MQWEPMHEHISRVEPRGNGTWHIEHIRDFIYTPDKPPVYRWSERTIDITQVIAAHFYMLPLQQLGVVGAFFAHTCIGFTFKNGTDLVYTIEGRQPAGNEYHPGRSSENVRIFATLNYFKGFRHVVRKRGFYRYPILLSPQGVQQLLTACLKDAHRAHGVPSRYHPMNNQCTTELIKALNCGLEESIPWHPGWHLTGLTHRAVAKHGLINLSQKETL